MYTTIKDQNIYYQKLGEGKDLIMLHGWKQDVSSFHAVAEKLKKDFTLWLIDLPGFGRSENPKQDFKVEDYADIVYQFIKENNIEKPVLLGHSVGGRIGIVLASKYPESLSKLILEDSAGIKPKQSLSKSLIYPLAKAFKYLTPNLFNLKTKIRHKLYKNLGSDYSTAGKLKGTLTNILEEDLTPQLSSIKTQTLILWGSNDPNKESSPANARTMYKKIPFSKLEFIEGADHFPHLTHAEKFIYFVKDFAS
jgi:pimeloyl-ACP methyl ester carboxylesterase